MLLSIEHIAKVTDIQVIVSNVTGIKVSEICSTSRKAEIVQARHLSMYFFRFNIKIGTKEIASLHGKGNHATVLHACNCIHQDRRTNKRLNEMYQQIESQIKNA
jgi:chromosomal replication initiator protein